MSGRIILLAVIHSWSYKGRSSENITKHFRASRSQFLQVIDVCCCIRCCWMVGWFFFPFLAKKGLPLPFFHYSLEIFHWKRLLSSKGNHVQLDIEEVNISRGWQDRPSLEREGEA